MLHAFGAAIDRQVLSQRTGEGRAEVRRQTLEVGDVVPGFKLIPTLSKWEIFFLAVPKRNQQETNCDELPVKLIPAGFEQMGLDLLVGVPFCGFKGKPTGPPTQN